MEGGSKCVWGMSGGRGHMWQGACVAGVGQGGVHGRGACMVADMHGVGGGGMCGRGRYVWQGACMVGGMYGGWVCVAEGVCVAGEMAIVAGGTHPMGIRSCLSSNSMNS